MASAFQQRVVCRVADQRVFELIGHLRRLPVAIEQFRRDELTERCVEFRLVQLRDRCQQFVAESPA